jgi:hypothetical protein
MEGLYQAEGGDAGTKFAQECGPFRVGQKRVVEAGLRQTNKINAIEAHAMRVAILIADSCFEHGRIIA